MEKKANQKAADRQYQNDLAAREEQREYDRGALDRLVVDAERAGFNPLTVLRNGGTSYANSGAPLLSRRVIGGSPLGQAIAGAGEDFLQRFDPYADQKREQEYRLIESQISSLNAGTLSRAPTSARRSYGTSDYERRPSGKAAALGKPSRWEEGGVTVTNPWQQAEVNPNVSDAAAVEERLGEIGANLYGGYVAAMDVWHNAKKYLAENVKVTPLSKTERKRIEESWVPEWVPRLSFRWR